MKRIRLKEGNCKENQKYRRKGEGYRTNYADRQRTLRTSCHKISNIKDSNFKIVLREEGQYYKNQSKTID